MMGQSHFAAPGGTARRRKHRPVTLTPRHSLTRGQVSPMSTDNSISPQFLMVVWELTLRCNLACKHCGSRAGKARSNELTTAEALEVVRQLGELRVREVALIGGEA